MDSGRFYVGSPPGGGEGPRRRRRRPPSSKPLSIKALLRSFGEKAKALKQITFEFKLKDFLLPSWDEAVMASATEKEDSIRRRGGPSQVAIVKFMLKKRRTADGEVDGACDDFQCVFGLAAV